MTILRCPSLRVCGLMLALWVIGWNGSARGEDAKTPRRHSHRSRPASEAQPATEPAEGSGEEAPAQPETVNEGYVILDGQYVPPPYTVEWKNDILSLNGKPVPVRQFPMAGGRGARRPWMNKGSGMGMRAAGAPARVVHVLREGGLVASVGKSPAVILPHQEAIMVLEVLLQKKLARQEKIDMLAATGGRRLGLAEWGVLIDSFKPSAELARRVSQSKKRMEREVRHVGPEPSLWRARIISGVSLLLSACAFAMLLAHFPPRNAGWHGRDESREGRRRVFYLVGLLMAMNVFDLVCTLLAVSGGGFTELNPIVERHLASPAVVAAFKLGVVAAAVALLISLRRHRVTQVATWWVCVVYAIVTLRWATYGSMVLF